MAGRIHIATVTANAINVFFSARLIEPSWLRCSWM